MARNCLGNTSDSVVDSRKGVGSRYEVGLYHDSLLVEQSPVDTDEDTAVAHGIMRCNERVVITSEQEHIAVGEVNVGLLHFEGYGHVDKGEIADLYLILEIESARGGHVGIGVVLGEITYRDAGMQCSHFMENRL